MRTERFEEIKKDFMIYSQEPEHIKIGRLWGTIEGCENITRAEILELLDILYPPITDITLDDIIKS